MKGRSDTIFAVATGSGKAALQVVRISGLDTRRIIESLCFRVPSSRRASLCPLYDAAGLILDRGIVLWLPGPGSYTGEDSGELHVHGGIAVRDAIVRRLFELGARVAEPGEFTRRAVVNGRLDLTEAEAIADLIDAETEAQRLQAVTQMEGGLRTVLERWAGQVRQLLATAEVMVDFPEEAAEVMLPTSAIFDLIDEMEAMANARGIERMRTGLLVAITGAPNAGKSSLINALSGRDVAIVSTQPGTTRDVVEARVVLNGVVVTLLDTAGLRETQDAIEAEGVRRAKERAFESDLVLHLTESGNAERLVAPPTNGRVVRVTTKCDLGPALPGTCPISLRGEPGLSGLHEILGRELLALTDSTEKIGLSRERHRAALRLTTEALRGAVGCGAPELAAEWLREALRGMGRITGATDVERVLDEVFANFCIGK